MDTEFARFVIVRNTFREYMQSCGEFWKAFVTAAVMSVLGMIVTLIMLPETKGKSLEELTNEG